ncbi:MULTISPECIES: hypothetical protein [unclassified Rhodococcus (in: high G+C Gram-positive bacteria)]|uniref:hypothetical protein n=1 Tax=unclassified Rhodococcus (in: high G+C Gram-positive bacteria) TaxID=192944 RepID=UPI0012E35BA5|nr:MULTISPECIES: hypothetical protein [unclassified Rhodococcus (in: high G+C Gram-positive bacteria)]
MSNTHPEARTSRVCWVIVLAIGAAVVGALVGRCLPPFVLDSPFWREFWTGPPAAGLFAVAGAIIAFAAAWFTSNTARQAARRDEWWDRAEWALNLAMSDNGSDRDVGLAAIEVVLTEATDTEAEMVGAVTSILLDAPTVQVEDNDVDDVHGPR